MKKQPDATLIRTFSMPFFMCVGIMCIMEYGSTPYIGMALKKNGCYIAGVQSDVLKTLP